MNKIFIIFTQSALSMRTVQLEIFSEDDYAALRQFLSRHPSVRLKPVSPQIQDTSLGLPGPASSIEEVLESIREARSAIAAGDYTTEEELDAWLVAQCPKE